MDTQKKDLSCILHSIFNYLYFTVKIGITLN